MLYNVPAIEVDLPLLLRIDCSCAGNPGERAAQYPLAADTLNVAWQLLRLLRYVAFLTSRT
jgi:hypothetical protein